MEQFGDEGLRPKGGRACIAMASRQRERGRFWDEYIYPNVAEELLGAQAEQLPPASSEVAQQLPNRCPTVVELLRPGADYRPNFGQHWPMGPHLARFGPKLTKLWRSSTNIG